MASPVCRTSVEKCTDDQTFDIKILLTRILYHNFSPVEFDKLSSINQDLLRLSSYARNVGFAAFSIEKLET